jgi:hypothetical protein
MLGAAPLPMNSAAKSPSFVFAEHDTLAGAFLDGLTKIHDPTAARSSAPPSVVKYTRWMERLCGLYDA